MSRQRQCLYDVLGVDKKATDPEIRKSYKKLALKYHPDKNQQSEEAAELFKQVQRAYEILTDPQERSWYDQHRDQYMRGGDDEQEEDDPGMDIAPFMNPSCYSEMDDSKKGFYTVYSKVFEELIKEEKNDWNYEQDPYIENAPSFGDSKSNYDGVKEFYSYWENFSTKRTFGWADKYNPNEGENRRIKRLIESENKKARDQARRTRNNEIRGLADWIKKRDRRWQELVRQKEIDERQKEKEEKERKAKLKKLATEQMLKEKRERALQMEEDDIDLEALIETPDNSRNKKKNKNNKEQVEIYCEFCDKLFRTEKAWQDHEKSKAHLKKIKLLQQNAKFNQMNNLVNKKDDDQEEEEEEEIDTFSDELQDEIDSVSGESEEKEKQETEKGDEDKEEETEEEEEEEEEIIIPLPKSKKKKKQKVFTGFEEPEPIILDELPASGKKRRNKIAKNQANPPKSTKSKTVNPPSKEEQTQSETESQPEESPQSESQTEKEKTQKGNASSKVEEWKCAVCKASFPSRNKLMGHVKDKKHAIYIPQPQKQSQKSKKKKGK